jgi:hypothetical protein
MLALTAFVREVCMVALSGSADTSSTLGIMSVGHDRVCCIVILKKFRICRCVEPTLHLCAWDLG